MKYETTFYKFVDLFDSSIKKSKYADNVIIDKSLNERIRKYIYLNENTGVKDHLFVVFLYPDAEININLLIPDLSYSILDDILSEFPSGFPADGELMGGSGKNSYYILDIEAIMEYFMNSGNEEDKLVGLDLF